MRFATLGRGIWDYRLNPPGSYVSYGCGYNPEGSLVVTSGHAFSGTSMVFALDDPHGTRAPGALPFLVVSLQPDPRFPCGTQLQRLGMGAEGEPGELLISLAPGDAGPLLSGLPWQGPGEPARIVVDIPSAPQLVGTTLYVQGRC